jgi:lysozyme
LQARGFLSTQAEATEPLRKDVRIAERAVLRLISVPLTDGQFDALVSFTFNLGAGVLQRSTLRRKVNRGEHESVPAELMKWVWAVGKGCLDWFVEGRRKRSSTFYRSQPWQLEAEHRSSQAESNRIYFHGEVE